MKLFLILLLALSTMTVFGASKVAVVKLIRGEVDALTMGKTTRLKAEDWVESGSVIKTAEKSFVKLIFLDKSQMNVGPNSEMKIESFTGKDSGVIDLVKGKIRSQVTKDYLQIQDKDKSKLFIKTPNAVMGVRGTDFLISTNGTNTSTILFEGQIVFNKLDERGELPSSKLEDIVDRGVRIYPGEFSVMETSRPLPTVPSLLNIQQREHLEKNKEFDANREPSNAHHEAVKSVVPDGLSGAQVSNSPDVLKSEVAQVAAIQPTKNHPASTNPDGYVKGDMVKPANGSFVHVDSGIIVPPGPGSVLDKNTNTYIPGQDAGKIAQDGSYIPPKNVEITNDGKILVAAAGTDGKVIIKEVPPPRPVLNGASDGIGKFPEQLRDSIRDRIVPVNGSNLPLTGVDNRFPPSGGFMGANDPSRVLSGATSPVSDTSITVQPSN